MQKDNKTKDIKINNDSTESDLLKQLKKGNIEDVIVNLTIQLEKRLKDRYGKEMQLLDMIDAAFNDSLITELEVKMLHNLRKSRNTIMHEGNEKGYYTKEVVEQWIRIVFKLQC